MGLKSVWLGILMWALSLAVPAAPVEVRVVTAAWMGYANAQGEGYYFEILRQAFPSPEWQLKVTVVPFARSIQLLQHDKADIVLGVYQGDLRRGLYSDAAVEMDTVDVALTPAMARDWQGLESLNLRKVQAYIAYGFDRLIPYPMYYEESSSLSDMLQRLNDGRIDAVLDYRPGMENAAKLLDSRPNFVIVDDVVSAAVYFGFADTRFGESLKLRFDEAHQEAIASGLQQRLFEATQRKLGLIP
ncbi:substrate-binding periplasmic protein [Shewanella litorisediminis]|uniref:Transporter substrate-binding domain-containing protein n=1 Tax=Shewanella litorisediminis TaxID=1173586 RepID=A0ABX7G3T7_9GAMM|nr:transporter substrate-binding domain-containing protein [Shewanella litorisediminis]MCL2919404.1 transporter substrate-binding domain-containing protein [Shewanella litorisediminis]QRH01981.1 transporter substrate-binding domain-containing protein [Shewanella litorisediminis]